MDVHSRGSCDITTTDPDAPPHIDHGYLADEHGHDLAVLRDGLVLAEQLLDHQSLAPLLGARITDMSTDAAIYATVAHYYHPVGTCAMGAGPMSVCDAGRSRSRACPGWWSRM